MSDFFYVVFFFKAINFIPNKTITVFICIFYILLIIFNNFLLILDRSGKEWHFYPKQNAQILHSDPQ